MATQVDAGLTAVRSHASIPFVPDSKSSQRPECFKSTIQECLFVLTATMSIGMSSFLYGMTTVITAPIGRDLKMTSAQITWINASGALTSGAFLLFFAKVADTFGRRPLLIFATGAFTVSALITGFANNAMYMDVMGGLMGLWSAAAVPPAVGILGAAYELPSRRKNAAFACFSAGNPVGFVLGSIFSGIASDLFDWRASFFLLAIIYLFFFLASIWTVPSMQGPTEKLSWEVLKRFDLFGILLSMAGIALFCTSLTIASEAPQGWKTGYVIALLILGVALMAGFVAWEGICKYPLMPLKIWRDRNFSLINIIVLCGMLSFTTSGFWLSLYMQDVLLFTPLKVALHLLPQAIGGIIVNIIAGIILDRVNNQLIAGVGSAAFTGSVVLLSTMGQESSYWAFIFPSLLLGVVGADLLFNVANMYVMSSLPPAQQSLAGGIFNTVTKICSAVGLGISASIYNAESTGTEALQTTLRPYHMVFWFCVGSAGCGLCFVPWFKIGTQGNRPADAARLTSSTEETVVAKEEFEKRGGNEGVKRNGGGTSDHEIELEKERISADSEGKSSSEKDLEIGVDSKGKGL